MVNPSGWLVFRWKSLFHQRGRITSESRRTIKKFENAPCIPNFAALNDAADQLTSGSSATHGPFQMKLHELELALSCLDLLAIASGQPMFGFGNLVELKMRRALLEFPRHQL